MSYCSRDFKIISLACLPLKCQAPHLEVSIGIFASSLFCYFRGLLQFYSGQSSATLEARRLGAATVVPLYCPFTVRKGIQFYSKVAYVHSARVGTRYEYATYFLVIFTSALQVAEGENNLAEVLASVM
jgi:hypothetical protein